MKFFLRITIALFCLLIYWGGFAQVCNGSLGDPFVNVNFGTGANPGQALPGATTTYSFTSASCPSDGSYTVVNSSSGCFNSTWHALPQDHTTNDASGYMMLVNASVTPGDFYVDTVKNLCASTTYEFAAWIMNVLKPTSCSPNPILPLLIFNIETVTGTILGTYSTGDISMSATPTWNQYGLFFITPINTNTVVIRLTNKAPGGCGNDLVLDDITFRPCGPTVTLTSANNLTNIDFCVGNATPVNLSAVIGTGYITPALQWQRSDDNGITWFDIAGATTSSETVSPTNAGIYKYRLTVAESGNINSPACRVASNLFTITVHNLPIAAASNNGPVCEGSTVSVVASGGTNYQWAGPGGFTSNNANPTFAASLNASGTYTVSVTDQFGCSANAATSVVINPVPVAVVSSGVKICEGDSTALTASGGSSYLWLPATGLSDSAIPNPLAKPADTITYQVVVSNNFNCSDTAKVTIAVVQKPVISAGPDKIILKGQSVLLQGMVNGTDITFTWLPAIHLDDELLLQPLSTPPADQQYILQAISNAGCGSISDAVMIKVYNDIFIPTAFSPNRDGLNDTWRIEALAVYPNAKVQVYNRYGQLVYESSSLIKEWNGAYNNSLMPAGAYTYLIDLKNGRPPIKGMVMIVQ